MSLLICFIRPIATIEERESVVKEKTFIIVLECHFLIYRNSIGLLMRYQLWDMFANYMLLKANCQNRRNREHNERKNLHKDILGVSF
jgi:hypothetical protein